MEDQTFAMSHTKSDSKQKIYMHEYSGKSDK